MKTTNKELIIQKAKQEGLTLGCWDKKVEQINQKDLKEVLENLKFAADTDVHIKNKLHVVEIDIVDNEVDLSVITQADYIGRYGDERWS